MSADTVSMREPSRFQYNLRPWGDLIYGSKEELQALGLGQGMAFPGELGGPRRKLKITDPRGFPCKIERAEYYGDGQYSAVIDLPGRERNFYLQAPHEVAPGVIKHVRCRWFDEYNGSGNDLIASGLVSPGTLPGDPGMRKTATTILPDGSIGRGAYGESQPGGRYIKLTGKHRFKVCIFVSEEESNRRDEAERAAEAEYLRRMAAMPRPKPLVAAPREAAAQAQRAQLRLVWSRPAPGFTIQGMP